jgi:hypothetical protein
MGLKAVKDVWSFFMALASGSGVIYQKSEQKIG